jgi:hypothetical protein
MASTPVFKSPQFRQRRLPGRRLPRTIPSTPPTSSPQGARQTLRRESLYRRGTGSEGRRTTFALHAEVPPNNANGRWIPPRSGAPDRTRTCGTEIRNLVLYPPELRGHGTDKKAGATLSITRRYAPTYPFFPPKCQAFIARMARPCGLSRRPSMTAPWRS